MIGEFILSKNKRIQSLEGVRGIMIFLIVLSHMEFLKYCNFGHAYELYWHNPTIAVDYFFMLSEFGMMYSFLKYGGVSAAGGGDVRLIPINFAKAKIRRLYFLYCRTSLIYTSPNPFWYNRYIDVVISMEVLYHGWTQPQV